MPNFNGDELVTMSQVILEKVRMGLMTQVGHNVLDSMNVEEITEFVSRNLITRIELDLLSDKIVDDKYTFELTFKYPATWWQYFKQDKMPKWFLDKYPVKYQTEVKHKTVKFSRYATYPKANINIQKNENLYIKLGSLEVIRDVINE